jgi:DNA processing protein
VTACDTCLRRAWLLGELAPHLERIRHEHTGGASATRGRTRLRDVLALDDEQLIEAVAGGTAGSVRAKHAAFDAEAARASSSAIGLTTLCRHDEDYPDGLRTGPGAPAALYVAGVPDWVGDAPAVAIVGSRRASPDGVEVARSLGRGLAAAGVTVVSGMALGIDAAAHAGALESGGRTIAVLATGADVAYPANKRGLHRRLAAEQCVLSEMPPGTRPFRWAFPARNRIIAGLARITLVVEAAERSGSLITSDFASELGREVAAVPGSVLNPRARGTNALLRDGAILVRDAQDVLDALFDAGCEGPAAPVDPAARLEPRLRDLLDAVQAGSDTVAALARGPEPTSAVLAGLAELELLGFLRRDPGGRYGRVLS